MKPIDQTVFGDKKGNCFSACVASILEVPLESVPFFMGKKDWYGSFQKWLSPNLYALTLIHSADGWYPSGLSIAGGKSPRGDFDHACVYSGKELLHDPHPSRAGLVYVKDYTILVPTDPKGLL